ncbi:hypothetical protein B7494_g1706 [Chlorociboria aeruginascens]|nr:hypothetical protein B7494_g1706 [Chlorociboria aeruginascens]
MGMRLRPDDDTRVIVHTRPVHRWNLSRTALWYEDSTSAGVSLQWPSTVGKAQAESRDGTRKGNFSDTRKLEGHLRPHEDDLLLEQSLVISTTCGMELRGNIRSVVRFTGYGVIRLCITVRPVPQSAVRRPRRLDVSLNKYMVAVAVVLYLYNGHHAQHIPDLDRSSILLATIVVALPTPNEAGIITYEDVTKRDGAGIITYEDTKRDGAGIITYEDTKRDGAGIIDYKDVTKRDGASIITYEDTKRDGAGIITYADTKRDGAGIITYADTKRDGAGIITYADTKRDGADTKRDGAGIITYEDTKRDGAGIITYADTKRDGAGIITYADTKRDGAGIITYEDATK